MLNRNAILELQAQIAGATAFINNVAAGNFTSQEQAPYRQDNPVTHLLVAGENNLTIAVHKLYGASDLYDYEEDVGGWCAAMPEPFIKANITHYPNGVPAGSPSGTTICSCDWRGPKRSGGPGKTPIITRTFTVDLDLPTWQWETAEVLDYNDPALQAEVLALLQDLRSSLMQGDTDPLEDFERIRVQELAMLYQDYEQAAATVNEAIRVYQQRGWLELQELDEDNLVLRPAAEGRMLECLRYDGYDWEPALIGDIVDTEDKDYQGPMGIPLFIGKVDGAWHALR